LENLLKIFIKQRLKLGENQTKESSDDNLQAVSSLARCTLSIDRFMFDASREGREISKHTMEDEKHIDGVAGVT
jgi:hypothetical protein